MLRSIDTRQPLLVAGFGAFCLSAVCACTGLVAGKSDGSGSAVANANGNSNGGAGSTNTPGGGSTTGAGASAGASAVSSTLPVDPGAVLIHRLNTAEYNNTVADVLGTTQQPGTDL
jgi:Protein of unknown function (DUF1587)